MTYSFKMCNGFINIQQLNPNLISFIFHMINHTGFNALKYQNVTFNVNVLKSSYELNILWKPSKNTMVEISVSNLFIKQQIGIYVHSFCAMHFTNRKERRYPVGTCHIKPRRRAIGRYSHWNPRIVIILTWSSPVPYVVTVQITITSDATDDDKFDILTPVFSMVFNFLDQYR